MLSPAEKLALLERYKLKEDNLPRIQKKDIIARYFGLERGQVRQVWMRVVIVTSAFIWRSV